MHIDLIQEMHEDEDAVDAMHRLLPVGTLLVFSEASRNAGRAVRVDEHMSDGVSVKTLCGTILNIKDEEVESARIDPENIRLVKYSHLKEVV